MQIHQVIDSVFSIMEFALIARVLLSWIPHDRNHPVVEMLYTVTEPLLRPFRQLMPSTMGMDLSPIFAFFALGMLRQLVYRLL
ncbi:YggT family protein [bacterium]|jgi:YggT family protein|nr:YggT family protein [bacterium]